MNKRVFNKNVLIIILVVVALVLWILPIKEIIQEPQIIGLTLAKLRVQPLVYEYTCSVNLTEGWNLVSVPCEASNMTREYVLSNLSNNYTSIHAYYADDVNDSWKSHNPSLPSWVVQDLTNISVEKGYWIKITTNRNFSVPGNISIPRVILLKKGWNLIGYPHYRSKDVEEALTSISGAYTLVYSYNKTDINDSWKRYNPYNLSGNDLENITPYFGYWINTTTDTALIIN
jgi:hypothetical protein